MDQAGPGENNMTSDPEWSPCAPGTLVKMRQENSGTTTRTRRNALITILAAVAGGSWLAVQNSAHGGMPCARVTELAPQYIAGTLQPTLVQEIDLHRNRCDSCNRKLNRMEARSPKA